MSQPREYEKNTSTSTSYGKRSRERERLRRKPAEVVDELPSFQEPRRITVERQDSLSHKIQTVLGDMGKMHNVIEKDPHVWLGTSRNPASNKTSQPAVAAAPDKKDREGTHTNPSNSSVHRSREQRSSNAYQSSRCPTTINNNSPYLSQYRSISSHSSNSNVNGVRLSSERSTSHSSLHANSRSHSINAYSGMKFGSTPSSSGNRNQSQTAVGQLAPSPGRSQLPGRERLQSYDVESIFQEMRMKNEEPLSEIQTPKPQEHEFNFSKNESKVADKNTLKSQTDSNQAEAPFSSDDDSSSDSDSSESDDDNDSDNDADESDHELTNTEVDWSLGKFMGDYQKPADEPVVGSAGNDFIIENVGHTEAPKPVEDTKLVQNISTRVKAEQKNLYKNEQPCHREGAGGVDRVKTSSSFLKDNNTNLREIAEARPRSRSGSASSFGSSPQNRMTAEQTQLTEPVKRPKSNQSSSTKSQTRNPSSSSSRGNEPDLSPPRSFLPRNSAEPCSSKESKRQNHSSPYRPPSKSRAGVRTKEKKSNRPHHSNDNFSSMSPSRKDETSSSVNSITHRRSHKRNTTSGIRRGRVAEKKVTIPDSPSRDVSSDSNSYVCDGEQGMSSSSSSSESEDDGFTSTMQGDYTRNDNDSLDHDTNRRADFVPTKQETSKAIAKRKMSDSRSSRTKAMPRFFNDKNDAGSPVRKKMKKQSKSDQREGSSHTDSLSERHRQPSKVLNEKTKRKLGPLSATTELPKSSRMQKNSQRSSVPGSKKPKRFPSLWVKMPTSSVNALTELCNMKGNDRHLFRCEVDGKVKKSRNNLLPSKSTSKFASVQRSIALPTPESASRQAEIPDDLLPSRRANEVQVAVAASTSELSPSSQSPSFYKRNQLNAAHTSCTNSGDSNALSNPKEKRRKKDSRPPVYQDSNSIPIAIAKRTKNDNYCDDRDNEQSSNLSLNQQSNHGPQHNIPTHHQHLQSFDRPVDQLPAGPALNVSQRRNSQSTDVTAGPADSSWPGNETKMKTSDQYMREGKRLKHEGDACTDPRTGRTRPGESLNRSLAYFQATLCFVMNGCTLERENLNGRKESSTSQSPSNMYIQTIQLLDYIRKMRPHDRQEEIAFKRLNIACVRSQALLYYRVYTLKKDVAFKCSEVISDNFKSNRSNPSPSPWHAVNGQSVVSPVSPAVPSPYGGNMPGPSPIAGTGNPCDQVTSSTQVGQVGKMASPSYQNGVLLSSKVMEMFKQFQNISMNLMQAHEKWDLAESLLPDHKDFFRHVDVLSVHELKLHSSLHELATYNKVILRQLRGAYKSPQE